VYTIGAPHNTRMEHHMHGMYNPNGILHERIMCYVWYVRIVCRPDLHMQHARPEYADSANTGVYGARMASCKAMYGM
jgi:hypothetical protein